MNSRNYINKLLLIKEKGKEEPNNKSFTPSNSAMNKYKFSTEIESLECSVARVNAIFNYLLVEHKISTKEIEKCLSEIKVKDSMIELFKRLHQNGFDLLIISDSNVFLIETILRSNEILHLFKNRIISNEASVDCHGLLKIVPLNESFNAPSYFGCMGAFCRKNICKGALLNDFIVKRAQEANTQPTQVIYVGDGRIDYCPGLRLRQNDLFFVRTKLALCKLMEDQKFRSEIKAKVKFWKNAEEIASQLE